MLTCKLVTVASSLKLCIGVIMYSIKIPLPALSKILLLYVSLDCMLLPFEEKNKERKRTTDLSRIGRKQGKNENRMVPGIVFDWVTFWGGKRKKNVTKHV